MLNEEIQTAAKQIDEYFHHLLHREMPIDQAIRIEQRRAAAHAELTREVLAAALDDCQRPGAMG
jgi:hypothetical protein